MLNSEEVRQAALEVGFDACGIAPAAALSDDEFPLRTWLAKGWNADLAYMARNVERRMDPRLLVEGAQSIICCISAYPPPTHVGGTAAFAAARDYHQVVGDMLLQLRDRLGIAARPCCDTAPLSDKHWAARAGLGWIGRHTLLVTPRWGSWVNLGSLVTPLACDHYDSPLADSPCHGCNLCVDACPNHALAPFGSPMLDAARCTAYYTTHRQRPMPPGIDTAGYSCGCDLCQLACPHNPSLPGISPSENSQTL